MANGYILVKDKDGKLKYFKDGRFFSVEEIEKARQAEATAGVVKKRELEPVMTYEWKKEQSKTKIEALKKDIKKEIVAEQKEAVAEKASPLVFARNEVSSPERIQSNAFEIEHLEDAGLIGQRGEDQKLVEKHVENVINKLKIQFNDEKIKARFSNLLATFFRGVRTEKELEYILGTPKISGGLEVPKEKIGMVLIVIREEAGSISKERRGLAGKRMENAPAIEPSRELAPPKPISLVPSPYQEQTAQTSSLISPLVRRRNSEDKGTKRTIEKPTESRASNVFGVKPRLEDIKSERKLIGPFEELAEMNLENMRRLGKNIEQILAALIEKFAVLAEQSLVKKMEGARRWKESPVFRLYTAMTMRAIKERKPIAKIIEERQIKNEKSLTLSEYEMMGKLSQRLNE